MIKLAIVTTHPIQYYAPLFRALAASKELSLHVFYLWDFGIKEHHDPGFQTDLAWDIPLLSGYDSSFIPNSSTSPGTHSFWGINNPGLSSALLEYQPDAIVTFGYHFLSFYRLLFSHLPNQIPFILRGDSHLLVNRTGITERVKHQIRKYIFSRYHSFLYVGEANKHYLLQHGAREDQLFFSPHAIDNERFSADEDTRKEKANSLRRDLNIAPSELLFLFAGKFESKKRPDLLLEAFLSLKDKINSHLLFVGSGELEESLRRAAQGCPHIHFLPFSNQQEMPAIYTAADILVLPSYGPYETWGLCVNEAFATKTPALVSSHVGCASDLIERHDTGLIFEAGSVRSLQDALQYTLTHREELDRWSENAYNRITQYYDYTQTIAGFHKALKNL
ncbi:MAG: glycosyltransferase family 4 protein [Bdellovibrionales bacterium]|nr:glycosyltransferase family 4 protein [Bdellovibrionales bacterium]